MALTIIAIISAVAITVVSMSGNMLNDADNSVWASAEARNIVDCYVKSRLSDDGEDTFIERVGAVHGVADMESESGDKYSYDSENNVYRFYYDESFKLVKVPDADIAGGYSFRLEMKIAGDEIDRLTVKEYNANPSKENTVYEYFDEKKVGE